MNTMTYNGYQAAIEYDDEAELFHGEVAGLRDVITFQGKSVAELKKAFRESIEDYLAFCRERGEDPEKPFSGQFVVRTDPQAHRLAVLAARREGLSLNAWVAGVLESATKVQGTPVGKRKAARSGAAAKRA
jgi:predicted HicB family RNase H-like nuclease